MLAQVFERAVRVRTRRGFCLALALMLPCVWSCERSTASPQLVLVTPTSVGNAGLLDVLIPAYERGHHVRFGVHLAGSGRALQMLDAHDADVVISHAPVAEREALRKHADWWYRRIMFNDFLLVGPPDDPADARRAPALDDALRRIAGSDAGFVSRGDGSGTQEREQTLWTAASVTPTHMAATGQGMAVTLRVIRGYRRPWPIAHGSDGICALAGRRSGAKDCGYG